MSSSVSTWTQFWHTPLRAERLAAMRILLGLALLTELLFEVLPYVPEYYGPHGIAPAGLQDRTQLHHWVWTLLFFNTDDLAIIYPVFGLWVAATVAFLVGFCTRTANVVVWLLTMCFFSRNWLILDGGDSVLQTALFLLMLMPTGQALSVDAWLRRRRGLVHDPVMIRAWPVRLLQIQLCLIYCTTGLVKLRGFGFLEGTWWDGTSIHYALNYITMTRVSPASLPVPFWLTVVGTYVTVWWETLFPLLVLFRATRRWTLLFGIALHLGIWFTLAIGWFGFYTMSFYAVWIPDEWWARWDRQPGDSPMARR